MTPRILPVGEEPPPLVAPASDGRNGKQKPKGKTGERFRIVNVFADFTLRDLGRAEIAVWLLLWRDTKADGLARTSQADLARRGGMTPRTVIRALRRLERDGLLRVVHRGGLRRGPSTYRVLPLARQGDMGVTL